MNSQENPYEASVVVEPATGHAAAHNDRSMFAQLLVVGILQSVAGAMELMVAGIYTVMIVVFLTSANGGETLFEGGPPIVLLVYGIIWFCVGLSGCLRLVSGISSFYFRNRLLMLISLVFGFVSIFTCYCAVTALPLGIYGLIIMLSPTAKRAFAMRRAGMSANEIRQAFNA